MSQQDQPDFSIPTLGPTGRDSRRSWHSELSWDGVTPTWAPVNLPEVRSKMFPRGCRGFIHRIRIYCRDSAAAGGNISVFISPAPYIGQLYNGVIAVPVGGVAAWRDWNVRQMWNYDSLFIWFYTSNANTQVAYDYNGPDCLHSSDGGVTWFEHPVDRFYIRVEFQVETAGDVPVSGTINNIEVPTGTTEEHSLSQVIGAGAFVTLIDVSRPGRNILIMLWADHNLMAFRVDIDGATLYWGVSPDLQFASANTNYLANGIGTDKLMMSKYDAVNSVYCFLIGAPFEWKRSFRIRAHNLDGINPHNATASLAYKRWT